ncbi:MAG: deoxyribonuclease IV [Mycoplasmataceae bacterium]|jgi:deoxyribonuclease-4|nr:deoxyribonuclease IV [Mycoplasmataceae bacterium]
MNNKILIGSMQSVTAPNYLLQALSDAIACNENCFMVYTGSPQFFRRTALPQMKIAEFKKKCIEVNFDLNNLIVHAPYVMNLASADARIQELSLEFLNSEIKRCIAFGANKIVVHPGSATNGISLIQAITNCINIINKLDNTEVTICIETMSGKGGEIGVDFTQINQVIAGVKNKHLIGVCLDTCHIHDAGYDLSKIDDVIDEFDKVIGLKYLKVVHLNDSKNPRGSHKDRHERIGMGSIGFDNLINFAYHLKLKDIPKILETPVGDSLVETYSEEVKHILNKSLK